MDGAVQADPATRTFFGSGRDNSGIEIPAHDADFYGPKDVPHGDLRERWYFSKVLWAELKRLRQRSQSRQLRIPRRLQRKLRRPRYQFRSEDELRRSVRRPGSVQQEGEASFPRHRICRRSRDEELQRRAYKRGHPPRLLRIPRLGTRMAHLASAPERFCTSAFQVDTGTRPPISGGRRATPGDRMTLTNAKDTNRYGRRR